MNNKNIDRRVIVVSGPSGSGKSTAVQKLVETNPGKYELIRSVTTRKRRADDDYYFFVTEEMFEKMLQTDAFLETNTYQGNQCMYGTPKMPVLRCLEANKTAILEIDVNGKKQIDDCKDLYEMIPFSVFITAPPKVLYQRLLDRGESVEDIIRRLKAAYKEMKNSAEYDLFIINENLDYTLETICHAFASDMSGCDNSVQEYIEDLQSLLDEVNNLDSVEALMKRVEQFCKIRNWDQLNNPKDLSIGVSTEANELLDIFRFKTEKQMNEMMKDPACREHIGEEVADTLFFLLCFCAKYGFNLGEILIDKIEKNNMKYPVNIIKGLNSKRQE